MAIVLAMAENLELGVGRKVGPSLPQAAVRKGKADQPITDRRLVTNGSRDRNFPLLKRRY
jgi:hypothetical protein